MRAFLKIGFFFGLMACFAIAQAQNFSVPQNYRFNKKSDYAKYERNVLAAIDWLESNPPTKSQGKRKEAAAFLIKWLEGTPKVSATIYPELLNMTKKNPELLTIFLGAWSKFTLNNPGKEAGEKRAFRTSLKSMLSYYKSYKNKGLVKDKAVDVLLKKERKGQLDSWINSVVKD